MHIPFRKAALLLVIGSSLACVSHSPNDARGAGDVNSTEQDDSKISTDVQQALSALPDAQVDAVGAGGVPAFVRGNLGTVSAMTSAGFLSALGPIAAVFRLTADELVLKKLHTDSLGLTHAHYTQVKNGLRVVGGELTVHARANGQIYAANGGARDGITLAANATIAEAAARTAARNARPVSGVAANRAELLYVLSIQDQHLHLAYEVDVTGTESSGLPVHDLVYVDAKSGAFIETHPLIHTALNRTIYDLKHKTTLPGTKVRSEGGAATADTIVNQNYDLLGDVYNYYKTVFGRDSYDNAGAEFKSSVHYDTNYVNAYWNGDQMVYGDGQLPQAGNLAIGVDVTAHELTHAVTENESNLTYSGESGGMNESMSDVFGESMEAWREGNHDDNYTSANTFIVGDDIWTPATPGDGLRYMDNPTKDGASLDDYADYSSFEDVHYTSGIGNLAWALLVKGGKHPRNHYPDVTVPSLGKAKASAIWYRANTEYLTSSSNYQALRAATHQAATDLFDATAADATTKTFDAVGVPGGSGGGGTDGGTEVTLTNGTAKTGLSGATNTQSFFKLDVPAGATNLTFTISGGSGDADLYTKFGAHPSTSSYDCRPYKSGNSESCTVAAPAKGTYYVMLNGYATYAGVSLTGSYSTTGGGGSDGGTGGGGDGGDTALQNGVPVTGISGAKGSSTYFQATVTASTTLTVSISGGTGDADLYVQKGARPTTTSHLCRPYKNGNSETCTIAATAGTYNVMLRGYADFAGVTLKATF